MNSLISPLAILCATQRAAAFFAPGPVARASQSPLLVFLLAAGQVARAQSTNSAARPDYQTFRIISERNIFDPTRSSRSSRRPEGPRPARVESFALVRTLSY